MAGNWFRPRVWLASIVILGSAQLAAQERNLGITQTATRANESLTRVALVIGNSSYQVSPLRNPVNDARAMAQSLRELGFDVIAKENLSLHQMDDAVREFGRRMERSHVALFYFAGHGLQIKGRNYLVPVDANFEHEDEVAYRSLDAGQVLDKMDSAKTKVNLMILDACRNNPFHHSFRARRQGLAEMEAPAGTLIAFATAPGAVALDGEGLHGIYTKHLLKQIGEPALPVEQAFKQVRIGVAAETRERQIPWESSSLREDFQFKPRLSVQTAASTTPSGEAAIELAFWEAIKSSSRSDDYAAYLEQFPQGRFVTLARIRQRELQKPTVLRPPISAPAVLATVTNTHSSGSTTGIAGLSLAVSGITSAAFSPDNGTIALAGRDGRLQLRNAESGADKGVRNLGTALSAVRFAPDGRSVAVAAEGGEILLLDLAKEREIWRRKIHDSPIAGLAFSPDGRYLLSASTSGNIEVTSVLSGSSVQRLPVGGLPIRDAIYSPDGRYISVMQGEGRSNLVRVLEVGNGRERLSVAAAVASFSVNGKYLLVASGGHTPTLFDIASGDELRRFARYPVQILAGAYAESGQFVATVDSEGQGQMLDTKDGRSVAQAGGPRVPARYAAFSSDVARFVVIDGEGRATLHRFEGKP